MDRISIDNYCKNSIVKVSKNLENSFLVINGQNLKNNHYEITIDENNNVDLLIINLDRELSLKIDVLNNANLHIESILDKEIKNLKIDANLSENATISGYFADFSIGNLLVDSSISLLGEGSNCYWKIASLSSNSDDKEFKTSLYHIAQKTTGYTDSYGVSKDESKLVFSGISSIKKNSKFSKTHQNAKIMVFDESSKGIAKPILKIDENEIEASHGATVGKVSDETLFYLTSRGLKKEVAKQLITLGYLKPIMDGFIDEEIKQIISDLIERRM